MPFPQARVGSFLPELSDYIIVPAIESVNRTHVLVDIMYQPNGDVTGATSPQNGRVFLEGPHYPAPHSWYAEATLENGAVVKVK